MSTTSWELARTQLYNKRVVYNQKRHGTFPLGNRMVTFERRLNIPKQLSPEFLLLIWLTNSATSRRIGTLFFLAFAHEPRRWTRKSFHGRFLGRQVFHAEEVSEMLQYAV